MELDFLNKLDINPTCSLQGFGVNKKMSVNDCSWQCVCDCDCHDEGICQCADCSGE